MATADPLDVERRTETAADRRCCLNRMMGGASDPSAAIATLVRPRNPAHAGPAVVTARDAYEIAFEHVAQVIARSHSDGGDGLPSGLAGLDVTVSLVVRKDGSEFIWSRRDAIRRAACRGT